MKHDRLRKWTGIGLVVLTLAGATALVGSRARAQGPQSGGPGQPGGFPGGPGFQPGFGGGMPGMMPGMMMGGGAMAATGSRVYVLRGNTVYAMDAASLRVVATGELPAPRFGPGGPGGFRGQPGQPGFPGQPGQ